MLQHNHRGYWGASPGQTWNSRRYVLDINYRGGPCYGRLAFIWRIDYIQDLPGAARRLLDSERFEGVPVSSLQERLCTLWQGGKNI